MFLKNYTGWWYTYPSEKYDFVNGMMIIPYILESHKIPWFQTTNQLNIDINDNPMSSSTHHSYGPSHTSYMLTKLTVRPW